MWNTVLPPGFGLSRETKDHCRAPTWHIRWVSKEGYGIPGFCIRCGADSKSGISGKGCRLCLFVAEAIRLITEDRSRKVCAA